MTVKGNCDRRNGGVHRGTPTTKGKAPASGALGRTGADPEGTEGRASQGEALGRTGADPAGTGALGRASPSAGQHRGEQGPGKPH